MKKAKKGQKVKSKVRIMFFDVKMPQDRCGRCNYKVKPQKTPERTYSKAKKQKTRHRVTHLEVSKKEKGYH